MSDTPTKIRITGTNADLQQAIDLLNEKLGDKVNIKKDRITKGNNPKYAGKPDNFLVYGYINLEGYVQKLKYG